MKVMILLQEITTKSVVVEGETMSDINSKILELNNDMFTEEDSSLETKYYKMNDDGVFIPVEDVVPNLKNYRW